MVEPMVPAMREDPLRILDPRTIAPPSSPNWALAAEPGTTVATPSLALSPFTVPAGVLAEAVARVAAQQPRTRITARSADGLALAAEERSQLFGFVDDVVAVVEDAGGGSARLAIVSRSRLGHYDFGVNRQRLARWIAALTLDLAGRNGTP